MFCVTLSMCVIIKKQERTAHRGHFPFAPKNICHKQFFEAYCQFFKAYCLITTATTSSTVEPVLIP